MPYNNNQQYMYPQSYQPMQANSYMMQPQYQPQPNQQYQPQSNSGLIWVQGMNAAKAFPVSPGTSQLLMDSESECFYIKTTDASGMPLPLRTFTYREVINAPKHNSMQSQASSPSQQNNNTAPQIDTSAFVTRTEFNELKQLLEDLTAPGKGD